MMRKALQPSGSPASIRARLPVAPGPAQNTPAPGGVEDWDARRQRQQIVQTRFITQMSFPQNTERYFYGWKKKVYSAEKFPVNCTSIYLPDLFCYILYIRNALQQDVILKYE